MKGVNLCFSNCVAGESALDRLCCALTGKTMLPHVLANVPQMLQNSEYDKSCQSCNSSLKLLGITIVISGTCHKGKSQVNSPTLVECILLY